VLSISLELPEFEVIKQLSFSMKLEGYRFSKNGILVKVIVIFYSLLCARIVYW